MTGTVATACSAVLQALAAARDDQIDGVLLRGELGELLAPAAGDEADAAVGQPGGDGRLGGDLRERGVGVRRRGGAAQHDRVARLQAQRGGVDRDVGARLVDDRDDAERHAHLAHVEAVGQAVAVDHLADGVRRARRSGGPRARSRRCAPRPGAGGRAARRRCPPRARGCMSRSLASRISCARALAAPSRSPPARRP